MLDNAFSEENDKVVQAKKTLCPGEEALANIQKTHFITAYYDAWEHDSEEDPIASLIRCLATTDWSTTARESLGKAAEIGASRLKATTNIDSERNCKFIIYEFLLPLMNALNQSDIDEYNNFISGNTSKETLNILTKSQYFTKYFKGMCN